MPVWVPMLAASLTVNGGLVVLLLLALRDNDRAWQSAREWQADSELVRKHVERLVRGGQRIPEALIKTTVFDPKSTKPIRYR